MNEAIDYQHDVLGKFVPVRNLDGYVESQGKWCSNDVDLILSGDGGSYDQAADNALTFLGNDRVWAAEFNDRIYDALFNTWDEVWRQDAARVSKEEWLSRMSASRVEVTASGYFTVYYDDGDLFWGHSIEVWGSQEQGVLDVKMVG